MKIYNVRVAAIPTECYYRIDSIEVVEKPVTYVGEGKKIAKDKIMKIDTIFHENHKAIRYFTYCLEGQQQEAITMLKNHCIKKANQYHAEILATIEKLNGNINGL